MRLWEIPQPYPCGINVMRKEEAIWFYKVEYQKRAHQEVEKIFRVLLPEQGLAVREEQIRLCHEMLDTLLGERIALCDAGVGIGKTYAYLVACVLLRKYSMLTGRGNPLEQRPVVVSTSSIALQKAIVTEYIPFLSRGAVGTRPRSSLLFGQWCGKERNTLSVTTGWNNESRQSAINRRTLPKKKRCCLCGNIMIWIR